MVVLIKQGQEESFQWGTSSKEEHAAAVHILVVAAVMTRWALSDDDLQVILVLLP